MKDKANKTSAGVSRRSFIKTSAAVGAATLLGAPTVFAQRNRKFRIALVGCGGRGNGALGNCLDAGKHIGAELEVVATADWFKGKAEDTGRRNGVPQNRCFGGADAYKKLLETNADIVLIATSPNFRPVHFEAAIKAGKHVFMEKPVAVDPPGGRRIIKAGELAKSKGLAVVAGTQRRHQRNYRRNAYAIAQGGLGEIKSACVWWCGGRLWYKTQDAGESDADYMVRNWVSFTEMSGDHIIEQHVHNLDIANWFIGHPPVAAVGYGGRARRKTGNQFDFFSIHFDYGDDLHVHSMCRQINGCYGRVSERITGTKGSIWGGEGKNWQGIDVPDFEEHNGPYCQEHIDLMNSIIKGEPLNEARNVAEATLTAIMGRISAYTGQLVRWSDIMEKQDSPWYNLTLKPTAEDFEKGEVEAPQDDVVAIPGKD